MKFRFIYNSLFFVVAMAISISTMSQTSWNRTYGGANDDGALSVVTTPDFGYMIVGYTGSYGNGSSDAYILKTDSLGQFLWYKTYGDANVDIAKKIVSVPTGYFVAGYSNSYTLDYDCWLLRLDANGDTLWTSRVGGDDWDRAYSAVYNSTDNSYIIVGETYSGNNQFSDGYIVKMDDNGDTLWTRQISLQGNNELKDVVKISDTRYAAVGTAQVGTNLSSDGYVIFFNGDGDLLDTVYYHNGFDEYLECMAVDPGTGDMMLGGYYTYDTTAFPKSVQYKIDSLGGVEFSLLAPTGDEFGMHILSYAHYANELFFFGGQGYYKSSDDLQGVILNSWPDGFPQWLRTYGTLGPPDGIDAVVKTYDNAFLGVGYTQSFGPGTQALLMFKIGLDAVIANNTTVSIKEFAEKQGIHVFPNPSDNQITFSANYDFSLRLYDANGRLVQLPGLSLSNQYTLDVNEFSSGYYFGEMTFDDGSIHYEKIFIQSK